MPSGPDTTNPSMAGGSGGAETGERMASALERGESMPVERRGGFLGLPERDRKVIEQSQAEKYPREYAPMVEQYLRNLSEEPGAR